MANLLKRLLHLGLVSIRLESTSRWQPAEFYSHKARAPPVASDLAYQTGVALNFMGVKLGRCEWLRLPGPNEACFYLRRYQMLKCAVGGSATFNVNQAAHFNLGLSYCARIQVER